MSASESRLMSSARRLNATANLRYSRSKAAYFAALIVMVLSGAEQGLRVAATGVVDCKDSELKLLKSQISEVEAHRNVLIFAIPGARVKQKTQQTDSPA